MQVERVEVARIGQRADESYARVAEVRVGLQRERPLRVPEREHAADAALAFDFRAAHAALSGPAERIAFRLGTRRLRLRLVLIELARAAAADAFGSLAFRRGGLAFGELAVSDWRLEHIELLHPVDHVQLAARELHAAEFEFPRRTAAVGRPERPIVAFVGNALQLH